MLLRKFTSIDGNGTTLMCQKVHKYAFQVDIYNYEKNNWISLAPLIGF